VTGSEPDLQNLTIPLPATRANALYNVQATLADFTTLLQLGVPVSSRTVSQFALSLSDQATPGDSFDFTVADPLPSSSGLIVIAGQSNAIGYAIAEQSDPGLGLTVPFGAVQLQTKVGQANNPITWTFDLSPQALQPYTTGNVPSMGSELTMGRMLRAAAPRFNYIGKFALGDSSLAQMWIPASTYPTNPGPPNLYSQLVSYISTCVANSRQPVGTFVWIQGETDATVSADANAYAANLTTFIDSLRSTFGNFRVVIVELNAAHSYAYASIVRAQQASYVAGAANALLVNTDDIALGGDGIHYDARGQALLGYRVGAAILSAEGLSDGAPTTFSIYLGAAPGLAGASALTPAAYPHQHGDILLLVATCANTNVVPSLSLPNGYLLRKNNNSLGLSTLYQNVALFEVRADQAVMDTQPTGQMPLPTVADSGVINAARIFVFRPPTTLTGSAIDGSSVGENNAYDTSVSIASDTTTVPNDLVALFVTGAGASAVSLGALSNGALSNITERQDSYYSVGGDYQSIALVTGEKAAPGAYGTTAGTMSANEIIASIAVALKP
jgi:hypothetical protein